MKSSPLLLSFFLFFSLTISFARAQEDAGTSAGIPSEFKLQIERYRNLAHDPSPATVQENPSFLTYESGLKFLHLGDGYSAIQTLKNLLETNKTPEPLKNEVHATLGYIYLDQNRPKEALEEFILLEKVAEFRERAKFGIAWSLMEMEEYVKSITIFEDLVKEFPDGEYTPEALSRIGYCYSRLLSFKNAVESYQKTLHVYNKRLQAQKALFRKLEKPIPFQPEFIFNNPDPDWKTLFKQIKNSPAGNEMIQGVADFFKLEDRLSKSSSFRQEAPQLQQSLTQTRTQIQNLFQKFIQEQIKEQRQILQDLSVETAIALARNLVLENSDLGQMGAEHHD